jgi:hypothetical protein
LSEDPAPNEALPQLLTRKYLHSVHSARLGKAAENTQAFVFKWISIIPEQRIICALQDRAIQVKRVLRSKKAALLRLQGC